MSDINLENLNSAMGTTANNPGLSALFFGIIIFSAILIIIMLISYWKMFKKAQKPGWATLIPIYNFIIMLEIAGMSWVYILLLFIPVANLIVLIIMNMKIATKFKKSSAFGIGMTFIPIIFIPILAFSDETVEEKNENSNQFNAMNVINNNESSIVNDPTTNYMEIKGAEIENINQTPSTENNIETTNNQPTIETEPKEISHNIEENPIKEETNNIVNIPTIPLSEEQETPLNDEQNEKVETLDSSNIETKNSNTELNISEVPELNSNQTEQSNNAIETINTLDTTNENIETPNAFNMQPTITNETVPNEINNDVEPSNVNLDNTKKICKNCGTEMPGIVSICPKCGTENE